MAFSNGRGNKPFGGKPYSGGGRGDKPYGKKPYGDNKPYSNRDGMPTGDRPDDRKPGGDSNKPYANKSYGRKPYGDRPSGDKPYGDRKPYGNRPYGDRPSGDKPYEKKPYGNKPYGDRPSGDKPYEKKPYGNKPYGDRPSGDKPYGDRKPYGNKPYGDRPSGDKPYGDRKPYGNKPYGDRPSGDKPYEKKPYGNKPYGDRPSGDKPYGDRKPYGNKPYGDRPSGDKPYEKKPYGNKPYGDRPSGDKPYEKKPYGNKSYGDKPSGDKPYEKKPYGNKPYGDRPSSDKPYERRPYGNRSYGDAKPYERKRPYEEENRKPYADAFSEEETVQAPAQAADEQTMPYFLMGRNAVREAIKSGRSIDRILVVEEQDGSLREIVAMARDRNLVIRPTDRKRLDELCMPYGHGGKPGNHQGIIAMVPDIEYATIEEILDIAKERNEPPFLLLLDEINDPYNLGSMLRSAACAGVHGVVLPKRRAASVTAAVAKASAGAVEYVKVAKVVNLSVAMQQLKDAGVWIAGAVMDGTPMTQVDLKGPLALVIGGEADGLSRLVREGCDHLVSIPMHGPMESLNASVAAAVLLFEKNRQDGAK